MKTDYDLEYYNVSAFMDQDLLLDKDCIKVVQGDIVLIS